MADVCEVRGILRYLDGTPAGDVEILVAATSISPTQDGARLPVAITTRTTPEGELQIDLLPGTYRMVWANYTSPLTVLDEPTARLEDRMAAAPQPVRGAPGLSAYALAVQQGFSGSLDDWLSSLGTGLPMGNPGDVIGYDQSGTGRPLPPRIPLTSAQW